MNDPVLKLAMGIAESLIVLANDHNQLARIVADKASGLDDAARAELRAEIARRETDFERLEKDLLDAKRRCGLP